MRNSDDDDDDNDDNNNNNKSACPILAKEQYIKDMIECVHNYTSTYVRKQE